MLAQSEAKTAEIIDRLVEEFHDKLPSDEADQIESFMRQYYFRVSPEDLIEHDMLDLHGACMAHWQLARHRKPGQAIVRVYNPRFDKHGWQSTHTIVETVMDDVPFLVDSVSMALNRNGLTIHLTIHPTMKVHRDDDGRLIRMLPPDAEEDAPTESFMHFEVDKQTEPERLKAVREEIERVLTDVSKATVDWPAMRQKTLDIIEELEKRPPKGIDRDEVGEAVAFCRWMEDHHFTFLGYCEYDIEKSDGGRQLKLCEGSELGVLRDPSTGTNLSTKDVLPTQSAEYSRSTELLVVTKGNRRSPIHRPAYMDLVGIKRFGAEGKADGERFILGLFTSAAYSRTPRDIPLLRDKVRKVMEASGLPPNGHEGKALQNVLESYPRDALFQISANELLDVAMGILQLQERQRIRVFIRPDRYGRFYSCLIYVPRDRYNRELRLKIQDILMDALDGTEFELNTMFSESVLARVHVIVHTRGQAGQDYNTREIESRIVEAARTWRDNLREALVEHYGEEQGMRLYRLYSDAFPGGYIEDFPARKAAFHIEKMEAVRGTDDISLNFYRPATEPEGIVRLELFSSGKPIPPSDALPLIENMGLKVVRERPYEIESTDADSIWIHEFSMVHAQGLEIDPDRVGELFQDAFLRVWRGEVENDGFNRLVLGAGLSWTETVVLRAYCKYLRQIRIRFSEAYMVDSLARNPKITRNLINLFHARFDPARSQKSEAISERLVAAIEDSLERVANLDEDRILRSFLNLVQATIRTNYFQPAEGGGPRPYLSFKFRPALITEMPAPRPMFEIFVYSPRVEAVHLRGGKVARGGLRWSDRREDFRTEVLGLVKAQMVKNAVIVPVGSKGGFVVKRPPPGADRETLQAEVVECYKTFIRGMLDITDNLKEDVVVPPENVVRHDEDDPYLVIAADKGTATFSDIANGVAAEYGFWLDDAFASGGSVGYDHKAMGITARGAWESVKRHFRELGIDTQTTDFTAIGVGDMSGDVFGNGMLLSRHIKLVAAFNHLHIFFDPDPDPEVSYKERERLFKLPRSTWADYDSKLISKGGGVWQRSAKSITLTPEMQEKLRTKAEKLTPNELISTMLRAPVDLLWNGGIGTYVKAESETHEEVGDRANDGLRVNAMELRCRVVGEGGNLGLTQLARIEFARNGGRIYTDAIDNSGGVDCSDHEVNIKILLNKIVENGDMTLKQRNKLLAEMTDEVAELVLDDNYGQTQAISIDALQAPNLLPEHTRFMRAMERTGRLDRALEFLPDNEELGERQVAKQGLVRPEISVLLAYSKMSLYDELLASDVPEDRFLSDELLQYFPDRLGKRHREGLYAHRLRREIIATHITNNMVNRMGPTFAFRLHEETGADYPTIARAYAAAREIFRMREFWREIEALDNLVDAGTQMQMMQDAGGLLQRATLWLLRSRRAPLDISTEVSYFSEGVAELEQSFPRPLAAVNRLHLKRRNKRLISDNVPADLANKVASLVALSSALDIVDVARQSQRDVPLVASVYFALGAKLELQWLRDRIAELPVQNHWHFLARSSLRNDLHTQQRNLTAEVISNGGTSHRAQTLVEHWVDHNQASFDRFSRIIADLKSSETVDFAMLSVALSEGHSLLNVTVPATEGSAQGQAASAG